VSGISWSIEEKLLLGFAHLFRPTYAGANVGHPSGFAVSKVDKAFA
jgi:hypothetical protein